MASYDPESFKLRDGRVIVIRRCVLEDANYFAEYQRQIALETRFTLQTTENAPSVEEVQEQNQNSLVDPVSLRLGAFAGDQLVGQLSFRPLTPVHPWTKHIGHFGMSILKNYWRHGIGRRMLEIMDQHAIKSGFTRIEARVRVRNERGVQLYKNFGFIVEGTRKQAAFIDEEYWDEFFIAKLLNISPTYRSYYSNILPNS